MRWIGTSGYSYREWKGSFYPEKLAAAKMFPYYAKRFRTVELNTTFYDAPEIGAVRAWAAEAPAGFCYALKVPQTITHHARLEPERAGAPLASFLKTSAALGDKRAALLFQLPPNLKKDAALLGDFLALLPEGAAAPRAAFEFRHASWHDDEVFDLLRARDLALCIADGEKVATPLVATASFGYLRLRDEGYRRKDILRWHEAIAALGAGWSDVFVYFKHEATGSGPRFARMLQKMESA
jgi:uncharacterized protein YecE (DUF72 family)